MAVLSSDTLTGCNSIPSFIGGSADTPANPSIMIFHNTNAPVNWVKSVALNNYALRVIGGANGTALTSGGSVSFTGTFKSYPISVLTASQPVGTISVSSSNSNVSVTPNTVPTITLSPTTLTTSQIPNHLHAMPGVSPYAANSVASAPGAPGTVSVPTYSDINSRTIASTQTNPSTNLGAAHVHTVTLSPATSPHTHTVQDGQHDHTSASPHNHFLSGSLSLAILYVDVIAATKS